MDKQEVILNFNNEIGFNEDGKHVRDGLSAALVIDRNLWTCCDERSTLERLTRLEDGSFSNHRNFDLNDYLHLPGGRGCEVDIEGLAIDEKNYLWIVGSHSLARKKPRKSDSIEKQIKRLAKVKDDPNRYILARIPLIKNQDTGDYDLCKFCPDPDDKSALLTAAQLVRTNKGNQLLDVLADDDHLARFMKIPGKDNGFDIEGLAVKNGKIFIGVRGPVMRGWAIILEIGVEDVETGYFKIKTDKKNKYYRKHFLHLEGMGIRDLEIINNDLLILAGPTMDLDGTIAVYRWKNGTKQDSETIVHRKELDRLFDVPHGSGETSGQDKAEGMALLDNKHLLIVFDSPSDNRKPFESLVIADLFRLP